MAEEEPEPEGSAFARFVDWAIEGIEAGPRPPAMQAFSDALSTYIETQPEREWAEAVLDRLRPRRSPYKDAEDFRLGIRAAMAQIHGDNLAIDSEQIIAYMPIVKSTFYVCLERYRIDWRVERREFLSELPGLRRTHETDGG
jgi:hypothetical protein